MLSIGNFAQLPWPPASGFVCSRRAAATGTPRLSSIQRFWGHKYQRILVSLAERKGHPCQADKPCPLSLLFPTRMLKMEYFGANFLGSYGERRTSFNFLRGFGNPLVDGNWGERPEVLMGKEEWIKIVKTGSKTLRTQGKTAWKMVVPGSKQNSVEGSAPGECCVPRGEEMVAMWL